MKKILLIEDRPQRQNDFLKLSNIDLAKYEDFLDNKTDIDIDFDLSFYDVIIAHQSIFINERKEILGKIKKYCIENNKPLVLFSGNNEISYTHNEHEELVLNSKDIYSANLILFLEEFQKQSLNIRILAFGNKWKLNILLNVLEEINIFIEKNTDEDIDYDDFLNKTKVHLIQELDIEFYQMNIEDNWVYLEEIIKFRDSVLESIQNKAI